MLRTYYVIKSVHKHHLPYDLFDYLYILRNLWPLFSWKKMPQSRDFDCKHHPIIKKEVYPQSGHSLPDTKSRRGKKQLKNCKKKIEKKKPTASSQTQS